MGGGISSDFLTEHATGIEELKLAGRTSLSNDISSVPAAECNSAWQLWYSVSENVNDHANAAKDALVHLSRLPMLKKTPYVCFPPCLLTSKGPCLPVNPLSVIGR